MADLTQFDLGSAARVARVVRQVEQEPPRARPLVFDSAFPQARRVFRVCEYSGAWAIGSLKTLTFKHQTSTPNTVQAENLFWPLDDDPGVTSPRDCAIARSGTSWFLTVPALYRAEFFTAATATHCGIEFKTLPGIALASHATTSFSMSVPTVSVITSATITNSGISFGRREVGVFCDTAATAQFIKFDTVDVFTSATITESALEFSRLSFKAFAPSASDVVSIPITTCATATS